MSGVSYEQHVRVLEEQHRPRPRTVFPYLLRRPKWGLAEVARAVEDHAEALDHLNPPSEVAAEHLEYVAALRAVASDARQLAERKGRRSGRALLDELRGLPSFQTMVEARKRLLEDLARE